MDHNDVRKRMYTFMCNWVTMLNIREKMKAEIKYSAIIVIKYLVRKKKFLSNRVPVVTQW